MARRKPVCPARSAPRWPRRKPDTGTCDSISLSRSVTQRPRPCQPPQAPPALSEGPAASGRHRLRRVLPPQASVRKRVARFFAITASLPKHTQQTPAPTTHGTLDADLPGDYATGVPCRDRRPLSRQASLVATGVPLTNVRPRLYPLVSRKTAYDAVTTRGADGVAFPPTRGTIQNGLV